MLFLVTPRLNIKFPTDRHAQTYEQFIVSKGDEISQLHDTKLDTHYCMVALNHLKVCIIIYYINAFCKLNLEIKILATSLYG